MVDKIRVAVAHVHVDLIIFSEDDRQEQCVDNKGDQGCKFPKISRAMSRERKCF